MKSAPLVSVVRLSGTIASAGRFGGGNLNDTGVASILERAFVKGKPNAVALVINSPGGSPVQSSLIAARIRRLADEKQIPVYGFVEDVAASGGYWISCASEKILANPTTLTGSIGVFGVIPDMGKFMENKLGITYDNVQTNEYSGFPSVVRPLKPYERKVLQNQVEDVYDLFLLRVSQSRGMSEEDVDLIGEGRVWSGVDAKENGLIDEYGGLLDAIALAAEITGLEEYGLLELPYQKDPVDQLLEDLTVGAYTKSLSKELGPFYNEYMQLKSILNMEGVQARLPYQVFID